MYVNNTNSTPNPSNKNSYIVIRDSSFVLFALIRILASVVSILASGQMKLLIANDPQHQPRVLGVIVTF